MKHGFPKGSAVVFAWKLISLTRKMLFLIGNRLFLVRKFLFLVRKTFFPIRKRFFHIRKTFFPVRKNNFPVRKNNFPVRKTSFHVGKTIFPVRKMIFPVIFPAFQTSKILVTVWQNAIYAKTAPFDGFHAQSDESKENLTGSMVSLFFLVADFVQSLLIDRKPNSAKKTRDAGRIAIIYLQSAESSANFLA